jgi:hypothetical protein
MMRARFDDDGSDVTPDWVPDPMVESPEPVVTASPRRRATVPVPSLWTPLPFGRHGGKTLPQLIFADPDYFFWGWENDAFACRGFDVEEVERIHRRATAIRPPYIDGKSQFIEHLTDDDGVFAGIQLAPAGATSGDSTLDMSFPRSCKHYDKTGNRLLVRDMKAIWFGDPSYRMNKARCEEFFNDESWFANP